MNGKVSMVFKRNCFPKMKDISRLGPLQAVTLIKIVVSEKLCKIDTLLLHTTTHTRLKALCPGLPGWASTRKENPIWILLKQETVSGIGISWAICKSAPRPTNSVKALKAILIIHTTHMAYRFMPFPVTLDDLVGHSSNAVLIKCSSTNICATFCTVLTDMARRTVHWR